MGFTSLCWPYPYDEVYGVSCLRENFTSSSYGEGLETGWNPIPRQSFTRQVFFKETKQHLKLGTCQSRNFDAQIAHITTCYLLYTLLAYFRRVNDYESLDGLFAEIKDELIEKNVAERLWELFDELLQVVITSVAKSGLVNIMEFVNSDEYQYLKELFENSFLNKQLKSLENAS